MNFSNFFHLSINSTIGDIHASSASLVGRANKKTKHVEYVCFPGFSQTNSMNNNFLPHISESEKKRMFEYDSFLIKKNFLKQKKIKNHIKNGFGGCKNM